MTRWRIGHRGASGQYPENTLLSFRKAVQMGANAMECDVHLCKSGEAVVIHDRTLKRTTNGKGRVKDYTLTQLQKLDAGSGERIPSLHELLEAIGPDITVFIEIKAGAAVPAVAETVAHFAEQKKYGYDQLPVISFHASHLKAIRALNPRIRIGLTPPERKSALTKSFLWRAVKLGVWSVNPGIQYVSPAFVKAAQEAGLKVITWTANSPQDIARAKTMGMDGIVSDYPDRL